MQLHDVLEYWMRTHGTLSADHRQAFLARPEVALLTELPDAAARAAVSRSQHLPTIVRLAQASAWWFQGERCEEDGLPYCARCKPHPFPASVVITRGWSYAFHRDANCEWLVEGQAKVDKRGGEPAPVEQVAVQVALGAGKVACRACFKLDA
jgi:hypothetical protein